METVAKFSTPTEATEALDILKARGISGTLCADEVHAGIWQGDIYHVVGYKLQVESSQVAKARECLRQLGFLVLDEEDE